MGGPGIREESRASIRDQRKREAVCKLSDLERLLSVWRFGSFTALPKRLKSCASLEEKITIPGPLPSFSLGRDSMNIHS